MAQRQSSHKGEAHESPLYYRVADIPAHHRPREMMDRLGADNVPEEVLLAIVLGSGVSGMNVVDLARALLREFGSLTNLAAATVEDLTRVRGIGKAKARVIVSALQLAKRLSNESISRNFRILHPGDAARVLREQCRTLDKEIFWVLLLNTRNELKGNPVKVSEGLLDASLVHAREIFKQAIKSASAAVVLAHNHPSGDPTPSAEDIKITRRLVEAGKVIDIKVLDHVIIGKPSDGQKKDFVSIREAGLVEFGGS